MNSNVEKVMRYTWLVVAMLWPVACLNYLDRLMITTMRDSIKADIAMTDAQFGLLTSVFLWVYALLSPFAGFLADRFSRSRLIVIEYSHHYRNCLGPCNRRYEIGSDQYSIHGKLRGELA